jgi:hypothetical protein
LENIMKRPLILVVVLVAISFAPAIAQTDVPAVTGAAEEIRPGRRAPEVLPSEITGTVRLNGWTGDASQITVHAIPGGIESPDRTRIAPDPRATERTAPLTPTGAPNEFKFSIKGLHPFASYRLGIEFPPDRQAKVFWRGLMGGIATAGRPPVALEGFIARTEVEIRDRQGNWVGADDLQFNNPETALRTLRWKSTIPGTVGGELQISTRKFPIKGEFGSCDEPATGLIYRQQFPSRDGDWQEIGALDFGQILRAAGRTSPPTDDRPPGTSDVIPGGSSPADSGSPGAPSDTSTISFRDLQMLAMGAPLYLRVVPVTERGRACNIREDGVHGWVILAKLHLPDLDLEPPPPPPTPHLEPVAQWYIPPQYPELKSARHPNMGGDSAYYVIKDHKLPPCKSWEHGTKPQCPSTWNSWWWNEQANQWWLGNSYDPLGQILVDSGNASLAPNTVLYTGTRFYYIIIVTKTGSCSGWCVVGEVFTGLVTAAVTGIGNLVTYGAEAFESIKDGVATVVADVVSALPVIGAACNAVVSCKDVIKGGIEIGLASMGLPPSLPNWNELKNQGMDYLAAEIASEMASSTGLPPEVTQLAADQTMNLAKDMADKTIKMMTANQGSENGPQYDWVLPYSGIDPAVWTILVKKKANLNLMSNLYLRTRGFAIFDDPLTSANPFLDNLYLPGEVHVPTEFPASNIIKMPIVLQPDYSTVPPPKCYQVPGYSITCFPHPNPFNIPVCLTSDGYNPFKPLDCQLWSNYIGVYYRDYWIDQRLDKFDECFYLKASAYTRKVSSLEDIISQLTDPLYNPWLPYFPPFHDFASIRATEAAFWFEPFYIAPNCQK